VERYMVRVTIFGAAGRMGRINTSVFHGDERTCVHGAVEREDSEYIGYDAGALAGIGDIGVTIRPHLEDVPEGTEVIVDFSYPAASIANLEAARRRGIPCVIGTTGLDERQKESIRETANHIPILLSPNMSRGVNVLFHLVERAATLLGIDYDVEITEIHHNKKKDSPSGTALEIGRIISAARKQNFEESVLYGRKGQVGERGRGEIAIHSLRASDVVGDHHILLFGPGERIELIHRSSSRINYARGALLAACFIVGREAGLYGMSDVIGFSPEKNGH
jgi:4-hydroxy-tetrahydrodipicolinate reductase